MIAWPFIAFAVIFLALVCAHFVFAYRAWRTSRGEESPAIDPNYVKLEDYFARSFRVKVSEWLQLPVHGAMPPGIKIIQKGRERIRVSGSWQVPPQSKFEDILVVQGSLVCGSGCTFNSEIYVKEDAHIGSGTDLQSIAADGNLLLGDRVRVTRWADSRGELVVGTHAEVGVRVTAGSVIALCEGAQVGSAVAPTIRSGSWTSDATTELEEPPVPEAEFPDPEKKVKELRKLSPDCWMVIGDLKPPAPLRITTKLIVKGDCVLPAQSIIEGDLKADGLIHIGAHSVCRGNIVANGEIRLGPGTRFGGVVHAGKGLWLSQGVTGGSETASVAAYASGTVCLEPGVVVHGKLASGDHIAITAFPQKSA